MAIAITDEQRAIQLSISDVAARTDSIRTVRALETGAGDWRRHWADLAGIGLFSIALPEDVGGTNCSLDDQCAALEQTANVLFPGPVLPTVLAAILLMRQRDAIPAKELLPKIADGSVAVAVALGSGTLTETNGSVSGAINRVIGADAATYLILPVGEQWVLLAPGESGVAVTQQDSADFSRSVATVTLDGVSVDCRLPWLSENIVHDLAATLFAAEASGVASWCLRTAVDYARVREQFGRPIGSFQAVKHICAEMLCRAELAGALAWDAARSYGTDQHPLVAAAAAGLALDAAVDNAKDCVQVLGGIGFTWEHDAHLYLRRAIAARRLLGGTDRWRQRATHLVTTGIRRTIELDSLPDKDVRDTVAGLATVDPALRRSRLVETGYLVPHWPRPYGLDASPQLQLMIDQELRRVGIGRPDLLIGAWAAPTIIEFGTAAQRDRFVLPTLHGEITWCQLFSEPEAGSDLASLRTKATRTDGGWLLDGQKVWTSLAAQADWAICLARTDPGVPKHRGITYFLVDMRTPGITIRPLREMTGDARFNEVFLDGVSVPDDCVVGAVGDGWRLARATLANERVAMGGGSGLGAAMETLLERVSDPDPVVSQRLGALVCQGLAVSLVDVRATLRRLGGQDPGAESSVRKLIGVRHRQDVAELAFELLGDEALYEFLLTRCLSIAGGTSQVLLNVIGERILGLPREGG